MMGGRFGLPNDVAALLMNDPVAPVSTEKLSEIIPT
jgi:hypothetical protein